MDASWKLLLAPLQSARHTLLDGIVQGPSLADAFISPSSFPGQNIHPEASSGGAAETGAENEPVYCRYAD